MAYFPYATYLRTHRDRWLLTQAELGLLLGVSGSVISKYERQKRKPTAEIIIGAAFIFNENAGRLFPSLHERVEMKVAGRSARLASLLKAKQDRHLAVKRELLEGIAARTAQSL